MSAFDEYLCLVPSLGCKHKEHTLLGTLRILPLQSITVLHFIKSGHSFLVLEQTVQVFTFCTTESLAPGPFVSGCFVVGGLAGGLAGGGAGLAGGAGGAGADGETCLCCSCLDQPPSSC